MSSPKKQKISQTEQVEAKISQAEDHVPVRYGMIGGGAGSWIGAAHRRAASLDGKLQLVAGVFSSNPVRSAAFGKELGLAHGRVYKDYTAMVEAEAKLDPKKRIQMVVIVTPNAAHFEQVEAFLQVGLHVLCDKPLCDTVAQARVLVALCQRSEAMLGLTHTYSGYPMVKEARDMVNREALGAIRKVVVQYPQGWLCAPSGNTPSMSSSSGLSSLIDVGTHAEHLVSYITGLELSEVVSDVSNFVVGGPRVPDDFNVLLRFSSGARGVLLASQSSTGEENDLRISVHGDLGGLEWHQEKPNDLLVTSRDKPAQRLTRGKEYLSAAAKHNTRLPPGHPEGYHDAFANIYRNFASAVVAKARGAKPSPFDMDFPTGEDGLRGLLFVDAVLESSKKGAWVKL